ncbi:heavy metal-associated isoprenylated plant protein 39-like [Cryptomeria japonica]|uniref:heavy metal-associated isoprenylated plant protein 39-like n=1 Tax=Cryptomeria japonica TaxID=3369 RepID=UPI0027DA8B30|nr:heavy metal-associated isoprenylated plant protein 39-like [Cryptomeria japonica]
MNESEQKKIVLKFIMEDDKAEKRAMKAIGGFEEADVDSVAVTCKLRKIAATELLSVGPGEEEIEEAEAEQPKEEEAEDKKPKKEKLEKPEDKETKEGNPVEATPPLTCFHDSPIYYSNCPHVRDEYPSTCTIL